jgi:colanic acid/amylovoran biosynthesis protein
MTQILIINLHSSRNAGDAALAQVTISQLQAAFPDARFTLAMNDPDSHPPDEQRHIRVVGSFMYWLQAVSGAGVARWQFWALCWLPFIWALALFVYQVSGWRMYPLLNQEQRALLDAYLDADLIVSAPGNFFYHSGTVGVPFLVAAFSMVVAVLVGKPLYTMPQSIGPLQRWWQGLLVRWVLKRARMVLVREPLSVEQLHRIGAWFPHCALLPDLAFAFPGCSSETARHWLHEQGIDLDQQHPLIGVTLINWGVQNTRFAEQAHYEAVVSAALQHFTRRYGGMVVLFPQVCGPAYADDDRVVSRRVAARLSAEGVPVVQIDKPVAPELLKGAYRLMDLFIGTRMHSNIFALAEGVPVLAIEYRFKTQGIMRMMGLEHQVVDIAQMDTMQMTMLLEATWQPRAALREHICKQVTQQAAQAATAGALISRDIASIRLT